MIVADYKDERLLTMAAPDDRPEIARLQDDISIPTALVTLATGAKLRKAAAGASKAKGSGVIVELDWKDAVTNPDDRVEWELCVFWEREGERERDGGRWRAWDGEEKGARAPRLTPALTRFLLPSSLSHSSWTTPDTGCGPSCDRQAAFKKAVKAQAASLERGKYTAFTPRFVTRRCAEGTPASECADDCIHRGRYCAWAPVADKYKKAFTGRDVVMEAKRQLCAHSAAAGGAKPWAWWDFAVASADACTMANGKFGSAACAAPLLKDAGIDPAAVEACVGDTDADVDPPVLAKNAAAQGYKAGGGGASSVLLLPTVTINGAQYRGRLDVSSLMRGLCAGFSELAEPPECLAGGMEVNECAAADHGGCWADAEYSACVDTFRGRKCQCPYGFKGDGYTCTDIRADVSAAGIGGPGDQRPALRLHEDPREFIGVRAQGFSAVVEAPGIPIAIPCLGVDGIEQAAAPGRVFGLAVRTAEMPHQVRHLAESLGAGLAEPDAFPAAFLAHSGERVVPVAELDQAEAVGTLVVFQEVQRPLDMSQDRSGLPVVKGQFFVNERHVSGFLQVSHEGENQPERAVGVGFFVHRIPSAHGQPGPALIPERGQQDFPRAFRFDRRHSEAVLDDVAVAVPAPAAPCRPEEGGLLGPSVHHAVKVLVRRGHAVQVFHRFLFQAQRLEAGLHVSEITVPQSADLRLLIRRADNQGEFCSLSCRQFEIKLRGADRGFGRARRVGATSPHHGLRVARVLQGADVVGGEHDLRDLGREAAIEPAGAAGGQDWRCVAGMQQPFTMADRRITVENFVRAERQRVGAGGFGAEDGHRMQVMIGGFNPHQHARTHPDFAQVARHLRDRDGPFGVAEAALAFNHQRRAVGGDGGPMGQPLRGSSDCRFAAHLIHIA